MWAIFERKSALKSIKKLPDDVLVRYEAWKQIVEIQGPFGLRLIKGFHDEALKGQWQGFRSSRLGIKWRVIYRVEDSVYEVFVFEVTPHDYGR